MGRVNNVQRMDIASDWGINTTDGTYLMHELAKKLHDIERTNPKAGAESEQQYYARLKKSLYEHEPQIANDLINYVIDMQKNSWAVARYNAIANLSNKIRPLNKTTIVAFDNYLPQVPGLEDDDVVQYDRNGNVALDAQGRPLKNSIYFMKAKMPWKDLPEGIPFDPKDWKVYSKYITRYIARMREKGVMPH